MPKILIINPFGIGDVLFTTPLIRNLKQRYPDAFIGYWCNERVVGLLKCQPLINKAYALSRGDLKKILRRSFLEGVKRSWRLFSALKKEKFDFCFDFSLDHRYALIAKFAGIKRRIGFDYKKRGRFLTSKLNLSGYSDKHAVEYYLDLLKFISIEPKFLGLELVVPEAEKEKSKALLKSLGLSGEDLLVGFVPGAGASWGADAAAKHWKIENFALLADKLALAFNAKVIILGDSQEKPIAEKFIQAMKQKAWDLTGKTSLVELAAIIDKLVLLVANDGGPMHMAVALGKKTLSFFGPVDPKVYGPLPGDRGKHIVLRKEMECSPCYRNFKLPICMKNRECLESINVDESFLAAKILLEKDK